MYVFPGFPSTSSTTRPRKRFLWTIVLLGHSVRSRPVYPRMPWHNQAPIASFHGGRRPAAKLVPLFWQSLSGQRNATKTSAVFVEGNIRTLKHQRTLAVFRRKNTYQEKCTMPSITTQIVHGRLFATNHRNGDHSLIRKPGTSEFV